VLADLGIVAAADVAVVVEDEDRRSRRALIEGQNELLDHAASPNAPQPQGEPA
jgi:hypothetical protein